MRPQTRFSNPSCLWFCHVTSRDVTLLVTHSNKMEESVSEASSETKQSKRGGRDCVAGTPNKKSCQNTTYTPGITMHQFPTDPKTREKWTSFARRHRKDFSAHGKSSISLCSAHFEETCFMKPLQLVAPDITLKKVLIKGTVPTRDTFIPIQQTASSVESMSRREKRQVSCEIA